MQVYASVAVEKIKEVQELCRSAGMQVCRKCRKFRKFRTSGLQKFRGLGRCRRAGVYVETKVQKKVQEVQGCRCACGRRKCRSAGCKM